MDLSQTSYYSQQITYLQQGTSQNQSKKKLSHYVDQYKIFFSDIEIEVNQILQNKRKDFQQLSRHNITVVDEDIENLHLISLSKPEIYLLGQIYNGAIFKYEIIIGKYKFSLNLLNVKENCQVKLIQLGNGYYGKICRIHLDNKSIVAKRIQFRKVVQIFEKGTDQKGWNIYPNKIQIEDCLHEYCIYKLCSFFMIGPRVFLDFEFDALCFNNGFEFYLEQCKQINFNHKEFSKQLKINLRLLHSLNIIHKDVKPSNFLYSYTYEKIVLSDFGISHTVKESVGSKSITYKEGTYRYMCVDMQKIPFGKQQYVDLYYNDCYGLKVSLEQLDRISKNIDLNEGLFKSKKIDIFYLKVYLWSLLYKAKMQQFREIVTKYKSIQEIKQFQQYQQHCQDKLKIYLFNLTKLSKQSDVDIQCLIRCYGMTYQLAEQLNHFKETDLIKKVKIRLQDKTIPFNQMEQFMKLQTLTYSRQRSKALENQYKNKKRYSSLLPNQKIKIAYQLFKQKIQVICQDEEQNVLMDEIISLDQNCKQIKIMSIMKKIKVGINCDADIQSMLDHHQSFQDSQQILNTIGNFYYHKEQFGLAVICFQRLVKIFETKKKKSIKLAKLYGMIAKCYRWMDIYQKFVEYTQLAVDITQQIEGSELQITLLKNQLGMHYHANINIQKFIEQLDFYILKFGQNNRYVYQCQLIISNIYIIRDDYMTALNYARRCKQKIELLNSSKSKLLTYVVINIGVCYMMTGEYAKSIEQFKQGIKNVENYYNSQIFTKVKLFLNISKCYQKMNQLETSYSYIILSVDLIKDTCYDLIKAECLNYLGNYWKIKKQYEKAIQIFEQALQILQSRHKISNGSANTYENIAQSYYHSAKFPLAVQYQKKAVMIREKIFGQANINTKYAYYYLAINYIPIDYNQAVLYLKKAESQLTIDKNKSFLINIYYKQAKCHLYYKSYQNAKQYLIKLLQYREEIVNMKQCNDIIKDAVVGCRALSNYNSNSKELLQLLGCFISKQLRISVQIKIQLAMQISIFYSIDRNSKQSLAYLEQGFKILQMNKDTQNRNVKKANYMYCLANKYLQTGKFNKAIYFYKKLQKQFQQLTEKLNVLYKKLSQCYYKIKKYDRAQAYKRKEISLKPIFYRSDYKQILLIVKRRKNISYLLTEIYENKFQMNKKRRDKFKIDVNNKNEDNEWLSLIKAKKIRQYWSRKYQKWIK